MDAIVLVGKYEYYVYDFNSSGGNGKKWICLNFHDATGIYKITTWNGDFYPGLSSIKGYYWISNSV